MRRVLIIFGMVVLLLAGGVGVLYVAFVRPLLQYWTTVEAGELMDYHLRTLLDDPESPAWLKDRCGSDICLLDEGAIMELASIGDSDQRAGREHWAGVIIKSRDAWGQRMDLAAGLDEQTLTIRFASAGRDGRRGTEDDIVIERKYAQ